MRARAVAVSVTKICLAAIVAGFSAGRWGYLKRQARDLSIAFRRDQEVRPNMSCDNGAIDISCHPPHC